MCKLENIMAFEAVARHKSYTSAATELGVKRNVTSQRVLKLEETLRYKLFVRTTRTVRLTNAGRIYLPYAQHVRLLLKRAERALAENCMTS